jgi:hypothetical protein
MIALCSSKEGAAVLMRITDMETGLPGAVEVTEKGEARVVAKRSAPRSMVLAGNGLGMVLFSFVVKRKVAAFVVRMPIQFKR